MTEKQRVALAETKKIPARVLEGSLTITVVLSFWLKGDKPLGNYYNHISKWVLVLAVSARNLDIRWYSQGAFLRPWMDGLSSAWGTERYYCYLQARLPL